MRPADVPPHICSPPLLHPLSQYYGVQRTIDGSGGGYVYQAVKPANPYALPSNGAGVTPYGAAQGVRAAIQYTANPDIPTIHYRDGKHYMVVHRER